MMLIQKKESAQLQNLCAQFLLCSLLVIHAHIASAKLLLPKQWEVTQTKFDKLNYVWTLTDVSFHRQSETCTKSQIFTSTYNQGQKWILELCFGKYNGGLYSEWDSIKINLYYTSGDSQYISGNYTLTLMNGSSHEIYSFENTGLFERGVNEANRSYPEPGYSSDRLALTENRAHSINDNKLIVSVDMPLSYESTRTFLHSDCSLTSRAELRSRRKYQSDVLNNDYPNLVLKTKTGKNVTTSESLFYHRRYWSPDVRVEYVDFDFETVNETVHFLRYGETQQMKKIAKDLFCIAKKYDFRYLKEVSEEEICNNLSLDLDALIRDLVFAKENGADYVKSRIVYYIASQPVYYFEAPQLQELESSHPDLMQNIYDTRDRLRVD